MSKSSTSKSTASSSAKNNNNSPFYIQPFKTIAIAVSIVAYIFFLMGFSALKNSSTFPGAAGASTVFVAYILALVGAVLGFIPVIGSIISLVGLIMLLVGWAKIKNAPLPEAA